LIPIFAVLAASQIGLYLLLRELFRVRGLRGRLLLALPALAVCGLLPLYGAVVKRGTELPVWARLVVAYPVLGWAACAIPLSTGLGLAISVARRWPRRRGPAGLAAADPAPVAPPAAAPAAALAALPESRRRFLARGTAGLLGGAAAVSIAGLAEAERAPELTRLEIPLPGLHPDLDGLTVLQLSDIHAGTLVTEERMRAWAMAAAALSPDLVVFTGDLLDSSARAAGPFARAFGGLRGRLGTFACLGNHDYYAGQRAAVRAVRDAGQALLDNTGLRIARGRGTLWICGVDDPMGGAEPEAALRGAEPGEPRILLSHRPGLADLCAAAGADLVLSGHTHGGQLALGRQLSPARLLGRHVMGHYRLAGGRQLYVHRGMGVVGAVPIRLGSPPELALLTLRRS
jgi:predicted MPP superfamily phosphohydrolase